MAQLPKEITEPGFEARCFSLKKIIFIYLFYLTIKNWKQTEHHIPKLTRSKGYATWWTYI